MQRRNIIGIFLVIYAAFFLQQIYNCEQLKDSAIKISNIPYCVAFPEGMLLFQVKWVKSLQRAKACRLVITTAFMYMLTRSFLLCGLHFIRLAFVWSSSFMLLDIFKPMFIRLFRYFKATVSPYPLHFLFHF